MSIHSSSIDASQRNIASHSSSSRSVQDNHLIETSLKIASFALRMGDFKQVEREASIAYNLDPNNQIARHLLIQTNLRAANIAFEEKIFYKVIENASLVIQLDPHHQRALHLLIQTNLKIAELFKANGNFIDAFDYTCRAFELDGEETSELLSTVIEVAHKVIEQALHQQDDDTAYEYIESAIMLDPHNAKTIRFKDEYQRRTMHLDDNETVYHANVKTIFLERPKPKISKKEKGTIDGASSFEKMIINHPLMALVYLNRRCTECPTDREAQRLRRIIFKQFE